MKNRPKPYNKVARLDEWTLEELQAEIARRESAKEDKSDPCPFCGKPFKTCGHF